MPSPTLIRRKFSIAVILLLLLGGILILLYLVKQQQDQRSRAADSPSFFPFGIFTDSGYWAPSGNFIMGTEIDNQLVPHNLNSMMFTNGTPDLSGANDRNFPVIAAKFDPLYKQWFNPTKYGNPEPTLTIENARTIIQPIIDTMKNNSSVVGYNIIDDAPIWPREKVQLATRVFNEYDATRSGSPMMIAYDSGMYKNYDYYKPNSMIFYNYPYSRYQNACDLYSTNNAPGNTTVYPPKGVKDIFMQNRELLQYKSDTNEPAWIVLQTHQTIPDADDQSPSEKRYPTGPEEIRLENWLSLASGVNGIYWFTYEDTITGPAANLIHWQGFKNNPAFYTEISDLGGRMKVLATTLNSIRPTDDLFSTNLLHDDAAVRTFKSKTANIYYVLVVNNNCSDAPITINSDYFSGSLQDMETGTTYPLGSSISFRAGDGKLFQLVNGTIKPIPARIPNLLTNGSFEQQTNNFPTNWSAPFVGQPKGVWDNTVAHTGSASFRTDGPSTGNVYINQKPPLEPNTIYKMSIWTKSENISEPDSSIGLQYWQTSPVLYSLGSGTRNAESGWVKTESFFKTPSDYAAGHFDIAWTNLLNGNQGWFDDAVLCEYTGKPCDGEILEPIALDQTTPAPTSTTPTPPPGGTTATAVPHWNMNIYNQTVEQWWANNPYNPANPNHIAVGGIDDGTTPINVCDYKTGSDTAGITEALAALPQSGGTLFFPASCSPYVMTKPLNWVTDEYGLGFEWVGQGANLNVLRRNNVHFVSDTNATITGSIHFTSMGYRDNGGKLTPVSNYYFKNLTFDYTGNTKLSLFFEEVEDILFDNVTFKGNGFISILHNNNVFIRNSKIIGGPGIYNDGAHVSGIINSSIENMVGAPNYTGNANIAIDFHDNRDATKDNNKDGTIDEYEERLPKYYAFVGNTILPGKDTTHSVLRGSGKHLLFKDNTIAGPYGYFVFLGTDARSINTSNPPRYYAYNDYVMTGNTISNVANLFRFEQATTSAKIGNYTLMNNTASGVQNVIQTALQTGEVLEGPNCILNNTINGSAYPNSGACVDPTSPTPTTIPSPTRTPTPTPLTTFMQFTALLHGIGKAGDNTNELNYSLSNQNPLTTTKQITAEVYESDPVTAQLVAIATRSGNITYQPATGNYTGTINMGTGLQNKSYIIKVKGDKYFKKTVGFPTVIPGTTINLPPVTLSTGDSYEDNNINIADYNVIYSCFSIDSPPRSCTPQQKYQADLNDDGNVNQFDYNLFLREISNWKGE